MKKIIQKEKVGNLALFVAVIIMMWIANSGLNAYQSRLQVYFERKRQTDISLEKIDDYIEQGYTVLSNIDHFNWTILEYYYPNNFKEADGVEKNEIDKAIMLLEQKLNDEEMESLRGEKYTITFKNQGQIDYTEYYLYSLEKK